MDSGVWGKMAAGLEVPPDIDPTWNVVDANGKTGDGDLVFVDITVVVRDTTTEPKKSIPVTTPKPMSTPKFMLSTTKGK